MQTIAIVNNPGPKTTANTVNKKGKANGSNPKTAKNKSRFTDILGQLASSMQPAKVVNANKPEAMQPETTVSHIKTVPTGAGSITAKGKMVESTEAETEAGIAKANTSQASATAGETPKLADLNHLRSLTRAESASHKTGKAIKSDQASKNTNKNNDHMSAILRSEESYSDPSQMKIAELIMARSVKPLENIVSRAAHKESHLQTEAALKSQSGSGRTDGNRQSSQTRDQESGFESAGRKNPTPKTEISLSAAAGENGTVKLEIAEPNGMNTAGTMLSKNQTDYLVSKMIQQINVAPSSLEVSLKPEYLGKVSILVQSMEGAIAVNVIAQNSEAMNLLNSNLQNIKDSLVQQGINIQQMEVNLGFQQRQGNQNGNYKGEHPVVEEFDSLNTVMDYGNIPYTDQQSSSSNQLNLLA